MPCRQYSSQEPILQSTNAYSHRKPLSLFPFTIDEFENALYQSNSPQACTLLQEVHTALLNTIRNDVVVHKQAGVLPLKACAAPDSSPETEESESDYDMDEDKEEKIGLITAHATKESDNFLGKEIGVKGGRKDWENMLIGCLWAVSDELPY